MLDTTRRVGSFTPPVRCNPMLRTRFAMEIAFVGSPRARIWLPALDVA